MGERSLSIIERNQSITLTTNRIKMAEEVPQEVLAKADSMDDNKEFVALYDFLHEQAKAYPDNFEIMWRIARVNFDMSSEKPAQKKEYILTSFAITEKLLALRPDHYLSHKWYAIVLSSLSDFRSTKEKIQESVLIKEHCLTAIFASPPESSYDEALKYFLGAEGIKENEEFLENLLWTGHTYHKLNNVAKAKEYYAKAAAVQPKSTSDVALVTEAQQKHA